MKAIETYYNGYRFRSRLEARWAVFFDAAGIKYEYEPEGFIIDKETCYLPDFYLPWFKSYVEIKPESICGEELAEAKRKCRSLVDGGNNCITLLCIGDPYEWNVKAFCNDATGSSGGCSEWDVAFFESCHYNDCSFDGKHTVRLCVTDNTRSDRDYYTGTWEFAPLTDFIRVTDYRTDFQYAKAKARQARFEFGE